MDALKQEDENGKVVNSVNLLKSEQEVSLRLKDGSKKAKIL